MTSPVALTSTPAPRGGLYEWSAGGPCSERLGLVSVLPGGEAASEHIVLGSPLGRHAISDDGSTVYFATEKGQLYAREHIGTSQARTVPVPGGPFQLASANGARAFVLGGGALSEFNLETETSTALATGVVGAMAGASEDGSWVYFVSNDVLGEGAKQGARLGDCEQGASARSETCSLYVLHDGVTRFIATLSGEDGADWATTGSLTHMTTRVSPNGVWLAFMSNRSLTGYDNRDETSGMADEEVYLYDAATQKLVCASCNPTGARPTGMEYAKLNISLVGGNRVWKGDQWLAANVPGWTPYELDAAAHQARYLTNAGRLFFNSSDALVSQATNGSEDVYEYEPLGLAGAGGNAECTDQSATFGERANGCIALISSGTAHGESAFLDASETGGDVFFLTSGQLVPQDKDSALDVYDAHECTSLAPCPAPASESSPACENTDSCRAAPVPQPEIFGAPSSATFSGVGNPAAPAAAAVTSKPKPVTRAQKLAGALNACRRDRSARKRATCERRARRLYGPARRARAKKATGRRGRR